MLQLFWTLIFWTLMNILLKTVGAICFQLFLNNYFAENIACFNNKKKHIYF